MQKYIKKVDYIDNDKNESLITLNDGKFEIVCFSPNYHEEVSFCIYAISPENIIVANNKECYANKNENGYWGYSLQGKFVNNLRKEIKIGKFYIQIKLDELPKDLKKGQFIKFDCERLDLYSLVIK